MYLIKYKHIGIYRKQTGMVAHQTLPSQETILTIKSIRFDILPLLKYMGFLTANVTAIEAIRLNGLTVTRQFVDAPTKYHFKTNDD